MMQEKTIAIIGTGLIGGSLALRLRSSGFSGKIIGVDTNPQHRTIALERKLVDEFAEPQVALQQAQLLILAIPVDAATGLLKSLLDQCEKQVIIDVGSTKQALVESVEGHPRRGRFVATHPMWGTEYAGPSAALEDSFAGKAVIICNPIDSDVDALQLTRELFTGIGMHLLEMNAWDHDLHAAYVSHISHITSFALANTVLEKEKEEQAIFELASAGFESTVRLAKSNPDMWVPIFRQNRENVLDVLNEHISQLRKFKACLEKENYGYLRELIENANRIRKILK